MTAPGKLADQAARETIRTALDTTLLVEAGAGSGKTTSLVERMLEHVRQNRPADRLAAVTFTRKAATELRERFEIELERAARDGARDDDERRRFAAAREQLDRAFLGTIHAFCARLLREHPLEAGLDPAFEEIAEEEWAEISRAYWNRWLERCRRAREPLLDELRRCGLDPRVLYEGFEAVVLYPDVTFDAPARPAPDVTACRRTLERLMQSARRDMPGDEPEDGWDSLQRTLRRLEFLRHTPGWRETPGFCDALASLSASGCKVTQKRWPDKAAAKALGEEWAEFLDGECAAVLDAWREHRYAPVMQFLSRAAAEFERERHATGRLNFQDLLLGAARLLRDNPGARRQLGERYRWLLVDEFQDTDPVQAEVCLLLASDPDEGNDWRTVTPRPGSLFVVGDPKQSIYRFRRADIGIYEQVKRRIAACGEVLRLTQNFRSVDQIRDFVNGHFTTVFPAEATAEQAAYAHMETSRPGAAEEGVRAVKVTPPENNEDAIVALDADQVASWIRQRIELRQATAGDFLILTFRKKHIEAYARALAARNVPATLAGAGLPQELELGELIVVLRALADPANPVAVVAALEGMPFGCSHADLWEAREAGLDLAVAHAPAERASRVGRALQQLYEWWMMSQRHPPDVLLDRIMDDTGMLAYAASLPLGESRAGTMLHLVERVRAAALRGGGTLAGAIAAIETALAGATAEAALRPGRSDATRVMNLHRAKGLEAPIVVLAAPVGLKEHPVKVHVRRTDGGATGGLLVMHEKLALAQPPGWAAMVEAEKAQLSAERDRLRYVAATRAKRELIITRLDFMNRTGPAKDGSMWAPFGAALAARPTCTMTVTAPPGRETLADDAVELQHRGREAAAACGRAGLRGFSVSTVTREAKSEMRALRDHDLPAEDGSAGGLGAGWGRALHRAVEAMGRGRDGDALRTFVRAVVRDERLAEAHAGQGAAENDARVEAATARLMGALDRIRASSDWTLLMEGGAFELTVMRVTRDGQTERVVEGVADAVIRKEDGFRVLDWKTDAVGEVVWERRREGYERQVGQYAEILTALTGVAATGELVRVSLEEGL